MLKMEHGNATRVDPETRTEIIRCYETQSVRLIAERYPFSRSVVTRILKEAHIPLRKGNGRTKKHVAWYSAETIVCLYQKGYTVYQLADRFQCSAPTIQNILRENGVWMRGRHGRHTFAFKASEPPTFYKVIARDAYGIPTQIERIVGEQ